MGTKVLVTMGLVVALVLIITSLTPKTSSSLGPALGQAQAQVEAELMLQGGDPQLDALGPNLAQSELTSEQTYNLMMAVQHRTYLVKIDPAYSHAIEEHGNDALLVRQCLRDNGPYVQFMVEKNKRFLLACVLADGRIGFQIADIVGREIKEKTAYIKDELKSIKQLFDYARRMRYPRYTKPL